MMMMMVKMMAMMMMMILTMWKRTTCKEGSTTHTLTAKASVKECACKGNDEDIDDDDNAFGLDLMVMKKA